jgi:hypothetical protein
MATRPETECFLEICAGIAVTATWPEVRPTWAALNPLIRVLGTLILRSHIERQLPEPLASPTQLHTWEAALSSLIAGGQLLRPSTSEGDEGET